MRKEEYDPEKNQWTAYDSRSNGEIAEAIYTDVGQRFRIDWENDLPVIDFDNLPDGLTEKEVKDAVKNNF